MSGHVRDLWQTRDPDTGRKRRNERWGKGKRWQAVVHTSDGRRATSTWDLKDDAERWITKHGGGPVAVRTPFEVAARTWLESSPHWRPSTRDQNTGRLLDVVVPAFDGLNVDQLDRARIQAVINDWTGHYAPSTVRVMHSYITSVLKLAKADGLIDGLPVGVKLPAKPHRKVVPLTVQQVATMVQVMPARWKSMVVVGAASGLRPAELAGLTWDRVDGATLIVDRQLVATELGRAVWGPPKSKAGDRVVGIGEEAEAALRQHRKDFPPGKDGLVWLSAQGMPMARKIRTITWSRYRSHIDGQKGEGWHQLRHFHASLLIAGGMSPVAVAARLGHKDASETLTTYAHLWPSDTGKMEAIAQAATVELLKLAAQTSPPPEAQTGA